MATRRDGNGIPSLYLITKKIKAISGTEKSIDAIFNDSTEYPTYTLFDTDVVDIISVVDELGNNYYEVPYLAQETIFVEKPNTNANGELGNFSLTVPYILELKKVPYRFSKKNKFG